METDSFFTPLEMMFLHKSGSTKDLRKIKELFPGLSVQDHLWRMNSAHVRFPKQDNDGLTILFNFLTKEERKRVLEGFSQFGGSLNKQPETMFNELDIMKKFEAAIKEMTGLNSLETEIIHNTFYQKVVNTPQDNDVQKVFHMDTFFPAWKFWYFPHDSRGPETGNFRYVRDSHQYDDKKMNFCANIIRRFYFGEEETLDKDTLEGSFRISEEEIQELYPAKAAEVVVPGNTLVIANVFGFHCRGNVKTETTRLAVHGSIRFKDPFKDRR